MPGKRPSVKNEKQYEKLKEKGMSKERAAKIANSPNASKHGGKQLTFDASYTWTRDLSNAGGATPNAFAVAGNFRIRFDVSN